MTRRRASGFVCLVFLVAVSAHAQQGPPPPQSSGTPVTSRFHHPEEGRPFVQAFSPADVGGDGQTWALIQDSRGVVYVGGELGVLEYDGATWRLIDAPTTVRSLDIDARGVVHVGSVGDFGYLAADAGGTLRYVSLREALPQNAPAFADVWRTLVTPEGVYFQTESALFRWANGVITVIRPRSRFGRASLVGERIYIPTPEDGLHLVDGDALRSLPGTQLVSGEPFPVVVPYDDQRLLIGTGRSGLFLYDGRGLAPFVTESDALLRDNRVYRGAALPDGLFAFTTLGAGVIVIDRTGRQVLVVDERDGLPSKQAYSVTTDREEGIWVTTYSGMARIAFPSPATTVGRSGDVSNLNVAVRTRDRLYFATGTGVSYVAAAAKGEPARVRQVEGIANMQCFGLEAVPHAAAPGARLFAGCGDGLYEVVGLRAVPVLTRTDSSFRAMTLRASALDPSRLWIGLAEGITSVRLRGGAIDLEGLIAGVPTDSEVRSIDEEADGTLWAGTIGAGVVQVTFATRPDRDEPRPAARVRVFGRESGLPESGTFTVRANGDIYAASYNARDFFVARFDRDADAFVPLGEFGDLPRNARRLAYGLLPAPGDRLLANFGAGTFLANQDVATGRWQVDGEPFRRFGRLPALYTYLDNNVAWLDWEGQLVRYDLALAARTPAPPQVLIRRVSSGHDRTVYGGAGAPVAPRFAPDDSTLRFDFATPTFLSGSPAEYQTRIDGLEDEWSDWSTEARREVMNLSHGAYVLRVRARTVIGQEAGEAVYAFSILPRWYHTWWAYSGYLALFALSMFGIDRVMRRRIIARERERSQFAEARLRADAAEQLARSEREGKKQVELLSAIGREITASLDIDTIFDRLYERLNQLADADVFGVGLYNAERQEIDYRLAIEDGKRYTPYSRDARDRDQLPVWSIEHEAPILINDVQTEYSRYVSRYDEVSRRLEDGSLSKAPQSLIYVPLLAQGRALGVITIQSFEKHAYDEHHLNVLQSLASYAAVAIDNAQAYRQLNEQEHEIRRLFEEAERARATAEEADAAKSAFLSTVSHELRTPLTSVLGFAKIIKKRLEDRIFPLVPRDDRKVEQTIQQVADNLQVVVGEGERLTKLIDDVLDLAKIEAGKLEWHMADVSMAEVIDHATAATSALFDQKQLPLVKEVALDLPTVTGDRDRLVQVVINLISNAVKFTDSGSVTCRAVYEGGAVVVSVIDTGVGIAPADQPKVFERFKQVGDTLTDKPKGTGLGLPICKEIVEHHGGRVWVESTVGQGSTFAFSLPLEASTQTSPASDGPLELAALIRQLREQVDVTTPRTADRQRRILVVDDEANIRELLTQEFTEAGYAVRTAANGREAVAKARAERPDLIVLDVMMPEMNGFDVAAVLKHDPATLDIPIVILSIVQDHERGLRVGVDRYLTKPIDTDLLFREVGALLEQKTSHKRVLVVDEDASTVRTLSDVLASRGYSVVESRDDELIERALALQPDIILLSAVSSANSQAVRMLRFEKGLEHVLFLVYQ